MNPKPIVWIALFDMAAQTILFLFGGSRSDNHSFLWIEAHKYSFDGSLFDVLCIGLGRGLLYIASYGFTDWQTLVPLGLFTSASTVFAIVKGVMFNYDEWSRDGGVQLMAVVVLFVFFASSWLEAYICLRTMQVARRERSHALAKETDQERARMLYASIGSNGYGSLPAPTSGRHSPSINGRQLASFEPSEAQVFHTARSGRVATGYGDDDESSGDDKYGTPTSMRSPGASDVSGSRGMPSGARRGGGGASGGASGGGESLARGGPDDYVPEYREQIAQAYSELLDAEADAGFTSSGESHGVAVFKRKRTNPDMAVLKGRGLIAAPPSEVFELLRNTERRREWDVMYVEHEHLVTFNDHYRLTRIGFVGVGLVSGRDILILTGSRVMADGSIFIISFSVESPQCPERSGYTRAHVYTSGYILRPARGEFGGGARTMCTYLTCVDLKGWLPNAIKTMVAENSMQSIDKVREVLARDAAARAQP